MKGKINHVIQHDEKDCGASCLSMISAYYGLKLPLAQFRELIKVDNLGANMYGLITGAEKIGLKAEALSGEYKELKEEISSDNIQFPFIARIVTTQGYEHYIVVYDIKNNYVLIGDPALPKTAKMSVEAFTALWQGQIVTFEPTENFKSENRQKGAFTKFFGYILSQKKMLAFVVITSLIISLINVTGSLVFESVIQKVEMQSIEAVMELEEDEHHHEHENDEHEEDTDDEHEHNHEDEEVYDYMDTDTHGSRISRLIESLNNKFNGKLDIILSSLNSICIAVICLYFFQLILQILRGFLLAKTAKLVDVPLTMSYYDHLLDLPAGFYGTRKTGEYMSRFNDTGNIRNAVSSATLTIILDTIMAVACGILLFYINSKLFIITCLVVAIYTAIMFAFKNPLKDINYKIMEQESQVVSYLKESIDGIETIKSYNYMPFAKTKTNKLYEKLADYTVRENVVSTVQDSLVSAVASVGLVVLLWSGADLCIKGIIELSDLMIFYYLIGYFLNPVQNLVNLQPELQTAIAAAQRLNDILDVSPENNDKNTPDNMKGDIIFKDVDFRYGNRELVLNGLNMEIKSGSKTAIVGESGSGKTTISKLLMQFYQPEKGVVTVNGNDISDYAPIGLRNKIAYISQNTFFFSDTVYNNLRMGNDEITDKRIEEVCKLCLADDFIQKLPLGYETIIEENGNNLSGGQRQRLSIARALLRDPDILIMDEATSNLDSISEDGIRQTIDNLSDDVTCIIIAHRLKTVKNCDCIYVLENGTVAEKGTHEELMNTKGIYYKNWN